jgi:hypothetical protein
MIRATNAPRYSFYRIMDHLSGRLRYTHMNTDGKHILRTVGHDLSVSL